MWFEPRLAGFQSLQITTCPVYKRSHQLSPKCICGVCCLRLTSLSAGKTNHHLWRDFSVPECFIHVSTLNPHLHLMTPYHYPHLSEVAEAQRGVVTAQGYTVQGKMAQPKLKSKWVGLKACVLSGTNRRDPWRTAPLSKPVSLPCNTSFV